MFNIFTDAVENVLDIGSSLLEGEAPSRRQVAKLIDAGLTVAAVATMLDVSEDVINAVLKD